MNAHIIGLRIAAVSIAALAMPASTAVAAESVVPPENSAASQYTEALPTAGGNKTGGGGGHRSPAKVLGSHDAKKLESHGEAGREVAEVVAATAPVEPTPAAEPQAEPTLLSTKPIEAPGGSSGLLAVIGQATGSSSGGELGLLLPLALLGGLIWAIAYLRRQRHGLG